MLTVVLFVFRFVIIPRLSANAPTKIGEDEGEDESVGEGGEGVLGSSHEIADVDQI